MALKINSDPKLVIGLKYCGGCNPTCDRVALVKQIEESLQGKVEFVSPESEGIDLVLAVQGCNTACADLSAFQGLRIRTITNIEDGENFIKELAKLRLPGPGRANRRVEKNHIPLIETKSRKVGIGFV